MPLRHFLQGRQSRVRVSTPGMSWADRGIYEKWRYDTIGQNHQNRSVKYLQELKDNQICIAMVAPLKPWHSHHIESLSTKITTTALTFFWSSKRPFIDACQFHFACLCLGSLSKNRPSSFLYSTTIKKIYSFRYVCLLYRVSNVLNSTTNVVCNDLPCE